jgi:hypothetical protein
MLVKVYFPEDDFGLRLLLKYIIFWTDDDFQNYNNDLQFGNGADSCLTSSLPLEALVTPPLADATTAVVVVVVAAVTTSPFQIPYTKARQTIDTIPQNNP